MLCWELLAVLLSSLPAWTLPTTNIKIRQAGKKMCLSMILQTLVCQEFLLIFGLACTIEDRRAQWSGLMGQIMSTVSGMEISQTMESQWRGRRTVWRSGTEKTKH
ncbi:hypothetical protein DNTS_015677 [Danionella cerebrum]|uniref:Uncharacterized protein n=1 Tax=Danionella cerebrum TaxID=2873325 RepID=A0A553QCV1_9TELE|nr:hypothetical protein DNTS_015677 [Danionella translucida]